MKKSLKNKLTKAGNLFKEGAEDMLECKLYYAIATTVGGVELVRTGNVISAAEKTATYMGRAIILNGLGHVVIRGIMLGELSEGEED